MNLKPIIFLVTLIVLTSGTIKNKSFEGVITYKTDIKFINENIKFRAYHEGKFGDTLKVYYNKEGDIFKKYYNTGDQGYDFNLYVNSKNNYYSKWKNLDTIYHYNVSEQSLEFISSTTGTSENILGKECKYIQIEAYEPKGKQSVIQKYYYSGFPYLDPELFKGFEDFYTNSFMDTAKSPFMKMELDLGDYIVTYTAVKIESKTVSLSKFQLPKGIPQKIY
ncbi:hypothetical protein [uncultured Dokdonia sp.]|uniref:hypothetical protein n=1 Tax=uncultured Dokdonia sp. TaxID=575653 RepID=UPI00262CA6B9|nr:hypothetical protein [uncultured Dokdonia sp.]